MVRGHIRLVGSIVKNYYGSTFTREDLMAEGTIGLLNAIERFNPSNPKKAKFTTFATRTIRGSVLRAIRDRDGIVVMRLPKEIRSRVFKSTQTLTYSLGRTPTNEEIGAELGLPVNTVLQALALTTPVKYLDSETSTGASLYNKLFTTEDTVQEQTTKTFFKESLGGVINDAYTRGVISEKQTRVLGLYMPLDGSEPLTQAEIAEIMGCTQMAVSRSLRRTLSKLRTLALERGLEHFLTK